MLILSILASAMDFSFGKIYFVSAMKHLTMQEQTEQERETRENNENWYETASFSRKRGE